MDFFKSVFSDDLEPEIDQSEEQYEDEEDESHSNPNANPSSSNPWSFGGLIKTLTSKSESVLETYRRDLEEFGSGLKKETAAIREVASRAVKDLPGTLDIGASVAQESLESVGDAIDNLGATVTSIIAHGKDVLLSTDHESDSSDKENFSNYGNTSLNSGKYYSRFEAQVRSIQIDSITYCEDPDDLEEFEKWKLGFSFSEKDLEIENLLKENVVMEEVYKKVVPSMVDDETFWTRYFYKIYKLKMVENARANLVRKAISGEEEEELSWDFDEEEDAKNGVVENNELKRMGVGSLSDGVGHGEESVSEEGKSNLVEKVDSSSKDSEFSIISSQAWVPGEEEDLGWDEIEDLSSIDEKKVNVGGDSPNKDDLLKRISASDADEDLIWDIEDDDEPVKP